MQFHNVGEWGNDTQTSILPLIDSKSSPAYYTQVCIVHEIFKYAASALIII